MVSPNVNNLLQQTKALTIAERNQLLEMLKSQLPQGPAMSTGDDLASAPANKVIKLTIPPAPTPEQITRFKAWRPIEMPGGPLSDDIIRDRR